jgi:hypothetical protein
LTAYESQRRLTRNYLEGARRKRLSYTPLGLWEAWTDLDAAMKVYVGSIAGFVISVSILYATMNGSANQRSLYLLSYCFLDHVASMVTMASLANSQNTMSAAEASNGTEFLADLMVPTDLLAGSLQFSYNCSGQLLLGRGYCGRSDISRTSTPGHGKRGLQFSQGMCNAMYKLAPAHHSQVTRHTSMDRVHLFEPWRCSEHQ